MDFTNYFTDLLNYELHANLILIDKIKTLNEYPDPVLKIMSHILNAQELWADRMEGITTTTPVWHVRNQSALAKDLEKNVKRLKKIMVEKVREDWDQIFEYNNTSGFAWQSNYREVYTHLMIHSSQHRGQIAWLLKPLIDKPLEVDFIFYKRNEISLKPAG